MKISLKWLNDFVDVSEYLTKTQELADVLTKAGLEVEEIQDKAKDFANVVVGHIQVKDKHPNADKLSLCQVEIAPGNVTQIVCGAQNHKAGDKVVVALPGAVLPGNFAIKKSKIRDVESNGMLCSLKELGLAETSEGIEILDPKATTGMSYAEYAGYDDVTFELKVTPNRADCLSHFGLARELGCLLNKPVKNPEVLTKFSNESTQSKIKLEVLNSELCPRYCGRYISGVKIGPSPQWLKKRLEAIGQNSINNVVDVTNYVMLEMGQPLHAFDADLIGGAQIKVRNATKGEKFKTLKEQELTMNGDELLICDAQKPVALAGVIGGLNSGVSDTTKNIFLESANFKAMSVRKTSRTHGVDTDSAYRFSRGVDVTQTASIMDRAALLIQQVAGGEAFGQHWDTHTPLPVKKPIKISVKTVSDRLGYPADENLFLKYMTGLQIKHEKTGPGEYLMTPPLFRFDIEQDMDLVEEYARLHGYEHIQETIPALNSEPTTHDHQYMMNQKISAFMRADGFHQAFNYAFTSNATETKWLGDIAKVTGAGLATAAQAVTIRNPLSEDLNVMRRSLSLGIWKNTLDNIRAGNAYGNLFETGSVFAAKDGQYTETSRLALIKWGTPSGLYGVQTPLVLQLRSTLEKLFQNLQISAYSFVSEGAAPEFLHLGQWAKVVVEGQTVGVIGAVHPGILNEEKVRVPVAVAELDLQAVLKGQPRPLKFKSLAKFQPVERDYAFVMESSKHVGDLIKEAKKAAGGTLKELTVFDVYEGDKLPQGQKSVALKAVFQDMNAALSDEIIQQLSSKIIEAAKKSVNAVLR
ncbi:MAG: phenylalanyl-tRNA synthetase beta chain [Pseudobdellovibrio sp.]|jgi:phenylalanyl-tRNA synthetase beta chain|nr:phenylalanyl-tRNA synthetase beta chain [Pseudobdellovibrio sp.]